MEILGEASQRPTSMEERWTSTISLALVALADIAETRKIVDIYSYNSSATII